MLNVFYIHCYDTTTTGKRCLMVPSEETAYRSYESPIRRWRENLGNCIQIRLHCLFHRSVNRRTISFFHYALPIYNVMIKLQSYSKRLISISDIRIYMRNLWKYLTAWSGLIWAVLTIECIKGVLTIEGGYFQVLRHWGEYPPGVRQSSLIARLASCFITSPGLYTQIHLQVESPNNWEQIENIL